MNKISLHALRSFVFVSTWMLDMHSNAFGQAPGSTNAERPKVLAKPVPLNWRNVAWKHTPFQHTSTSTGAHFFQILDSQEKRFRIDFVFQNSTFSVPRSSRVAFGAMVDNVLLGGGKEYTYEKIQSLSQELGLQVGSNLTSRGQLQFTVSGLSDDVDTALKIASDILLNYQLRDSGLEFWKTDKEQEFASILDASSSQKQSKFIDQELSKAAFGDDHFYSESILRMSPSQTKQVKKQLMFELAQKTIVQAGTYVFATGNVPQKTLSQIKTLVSKLNAGEPTAIEWLPERLKTSLPPGKTGVIFIQKPDMAQSNASYRCYMPAGGRLNRIEATQMAILSDVYSSQGGVVGNDRFSKAMRADSGISYSAGARFDRKFLFPNTNVPLFAMGFQTSGERTLEALDIASKTFTLFYSQGATADEFENAKISMMNRAMATEDTIFDKSEEVVQEILDGELPSTQPVLDSLIRLEKQKAVKFANETLRNLTSESMKCFTVLFGNTPEKAIEALKNGSNPNFLHLKTISFESIVKPYLTNK